VKLVAKEKYSENETSHIH